MNTMPKRPIPIENVPEYQTMPVWLELKGRCIDLVRIGDVTYHNGEPYSVEYRTWWVQGEMMLNFYGITWRLWESDISLPSLKEREDAPW